MPDGWGVGTVGTLLTPADGTVLGEPGPATGGTGTMLDDFNNRTISGALGPSSSGPLWVNDSPAHSVAAGIASAGAPSHVPHLPTATTLQGIGGFTYGFLVRADGPIGDVLDHFEPGAGEVIVGFSDGVNDSYVFGDDPSHPSYFVQIEFTNGTWDYSSGGLPQISVWGGDDINNGASTTPYAFGAPLSDPVVFVTGQWYRVDFHIVPGVLMEARVYPNGETAPPYQCSSNLIYDANGIAGGPDRPTGAYTWLDLEVASFDDLSYAPDSARAGGVETFSTRVQTGGNGSIDAWGPSEFPGNPPWTGDSANVPFHGTSMFGVSGGQGYIDMQEAPYSGNTDPIAAVVLGPLTPAVEVTGLLHIETTGSAAPEMEVPFVYLAVPNADGTGISDRFSGAEFLSGSFLGSNLGVYDARTGGGAVTYVRNYASGNMASGAVANPIVNEALAYRVRMDDAGMHARVWDASTTEPTDWQAEQLWATPPDDPGYTMLAVSGFVGGIGVTGLAIYDNIGITGSLGPGQSGGAIGTGGSGAVAPIDPYGPIGTGISR